jgi:DNA invertase Pin-like site-specific DNA recombinase
MITQGKVTTEHLQRLAYLYVRQSSLHQVHDNRESAARQYELKRRAQALGRNAEQLVIIDEDQGLPGASAAERSGFQRMVAEVGLGRVGVVMGLEVSRLARNSADGTACSKSVRFPIRLSWTRTASTTPATSTTGCCWG